MKFWRTVAPIGLALLLTISLLISPFTTDSASAALFNKKAKGKPTTAAVQAGGKVSEASPPALLQELRQYLDDYQPQVSILSPRPNEVLKDDTVTVKFQVKDLPIFKDEKLGLGPHLHVLLDNGPYQAVYDLNKPLVFEKIAPGTHTIRAIASRPWHETFKNDGAFAQLTFHVFAKTEDNSPKPDLPLLTYSRPQGSYGAEPIMLDYYLTNAPLHLVAQEDESIADWRIRVTVNGNNFVLDRWQPIYLKGFRAGQNWVQIEYLDERGNPVKNVFNNTIRLVNYEPGGKDTLSRIVRGEVTLADVKGIVDPNYVPPAPPKPEPEPIVTPTPEASPAPVVKPTPLPEVSPTPAVPEVPTKSVAPSDKKVVPTPPKTVPPEPSKPRSSVTPTQPPVTPERKIEVEPPPLVTPKPKTESEPTPAVKSEPIPERLTAPRSIPTPEPVKPTPQADQQPSQTEASDRPQRPSFDETQSVPAPKPARKVLKARPMPMDTPRPQATPTVPATPPTPAPVVKEPAASPPIERAKPTPEGLERSPEQTPSPKLETPAASKPAVPTQQQQMNADEMRQEQTQVTDVEEQPQPESAPIPATPKLSAPTPTASPMNGLNELRRQFNRVRQKVTE